MMTSLSPGSGEMLSTVRYARGALGLVKTFRSWNPTFDGDVVLLHERGVPPALLAEFSTQGVIQIQIQRGLGKKGPGWNRDSRYRGTWNKLLSFNQTQYTKILFLDADIAVVSSLAYWLSLPVKHGKLWARAGMQGFNSGAMLFKPSSSLFEALRVLYQKGSEKVSSSNFGDQELLNHHFRHWEELPGHCLAQDVCRTVPEFRRGHPITCDEHCKVRHFNGPNKPFSDKFWYCRYMQEPCRTRSAHP